MMIRITSAQVPSVWEVVKFAALEAASVPSEFVPVYCENLLMDLLSGKLQCYMSKGEDSKIGFVALVEYTHNRMTLAKQLNISVVYAFSGQTMETWHKFYQDMVALGKKENCYSIVGESKNPRIMDIMKQLGVQLPAQNYEFVIGG